MEIVKEGLFGAVEAFGGQLLHEHIPTTSRKKSDSSLSVLRKNESCN